MLSLLITISMFWSPEFEDESLASLLEYPKNQVGDCLRVEFIEGDYFYRQDYRIERIENPFYINSKLMATDDPLVFSHSYPVIEIREKISFMNQNAVLIDCPIIE